MAAIVIVFLRAKDLQFSWREGQILLWIGFQNFIVLVRVSRYDITRSLCCCNFRTGPMDRRFGRGSRACGCNGMEGGRRICCCWPFQWTGKRASNVLSSSLDVELGMLGTWNPVLSLLV